MSDQKPAAKKHPIHVQMDETTSRGAYANVARVVHSQTEFILDAMFLPPRSHHARVVSRVILTPVHAKRLLQALTQNVHNYEASFGEIQLPLPDPSNEPDPFLH